MDFAQVSKIRLEGKPYDAEVEYLESTGTQYIDTGLNYFPEYEIGAVVPDAVGNNTLGLDQSWKLGRDNADNPVWRATINHVGYPTGVSCGTYADMSYHGTTFRCNSDTLTVPPNQYVEGTMVLFSTGVALPSAYPLKLYYCRLFDQNGILVRDYIPVRKNGIGYLFDKVSGQLFGNQGTAAFLYGSDVKCYSVAKIERGSTTLWKKRPYDAEVEYLESDGTQYIDTGVVGNNNCKVSARGQVSNGACFARLAEYIDATTRYASIFILCGNSIPNINGAYNTSGPTNLIITSSFGDWVDATIENRKLTVNGTSVFTDAFQMPALHATIQLFGAVIYGEGTQLLTSAKLATVKIWKDGVLVRDYIPVRKNGVGYLFDKVSGQLFGSQTASAFGYGPDLEVSND